MRSAGDIFNSKAGVARTMITSEQAKHYGDLAAYGIGGYASVAFWTEVASTGTIFLTFLGALLSVIWLGWRVADRWRFGPAQRRGGDDG